MGINILLLVAIMVIIWIAAAIFYLSESWRVGIGLTIIGLGLLAWIISSTFVPGVVAHEEIVTPTVMKVDEGKEIQLVTYLTDRGEPFTVKMTERISDGYKVKVITYVDGPYNWISYKNNYSKKLVPVKVD